MSPGPEFFQPGMGRRFYESTMPDIAIALLRIAGAMEKPPAQDGPWNNPARQHEITTLLNRLADAQHGFCYCVEHQSHCPGGDCDGCPECLTGKARSILFDMGLA